MVWILVNNPRLKCVNTLCFKLGIRALALFTVLLLSACVTPKLNKPDKDVAWLNDTAYFTAKQAHFDALNNWKYNARVSVTTPQSNDQASMNWRFSDQANSIRLYGPLGLGAVRIEFDDYGVVLSDNKGVRHRGDSVQELLDKIVGWPIPVDALTQWLFLVPHADTPFRYRLDEQQRLAVLEQKGWRIEYSDYKDFSGQLMPRKITASRLDSMILNPDSGQSKAQVKVKLISKRWQW